MLNPARRETAKNTISTVCTLLMSVGADELEEYLRDEEMFAKGVGELDPGGLNRGPDAANRKLAFAVTRKIVELRSWMEKETRTMIQGLPPRKG